MRRDALVVGINRYPYLKDTPASPAKHLTTPAGDAEAIAQVLEEYGGFNVKRLPASNIGGKLQVDPNTSVSREELSTEIKKLFTNNSQDTALLFFAGHGLQELNSLGTKKKISLVASYAKDKKENGVLLNDLWELLEESPVKEQIIWLDSCYSGELLEFQDSDFPRRVSGRRRFIIAASHSSEVAYERLDRKHGVLSGALIEGLDPSKIAQGDWITDRTLADFVKRELKKYYELTKIPQIPKIRISDQEIRLIKGKAQSNINKQSETNRSPERKRRFFLPQLVDVSTFTGRDDELKQLEDLLLKSQGTEFCSIAGLIGTPGMGKSALAFYFATIHEADFPDGVIGLQVDGKDANTIARELVRRFDEEIDPDDERDAATIMQEVFAHRRMLLIFDNADNDSIRQLRPGGSRCAVIVTTRDRELAISLEIPRERRINLSKLPEADALLLLEKFIGRKRIETEPEVARQLLVLVDYLPIAIKIIASQLSLDERRSLARHLKRLTEQKQLAQFKFGESKHLDLFACFSMSLEHLNKDEINFFACLSVCAKNGFSLLTTMAVTAYDEYTTEDYLMQLYKISLIDYSDKEKDRFVFHTLIHQFAEEKAIELGLQEETAKRHAEYFIELTKQNIDIRNSYIPPIIEQEINEIILATNWLLEKQELEKQEIDTEFTDRLNILFEENGYSKDASELMHRFQLLAEQNKDWINYIDFCTRRAKFLSLQGELSKAKNTLQNIPDNLDKITPYNERKRYEIKYRTRLGSILQRQGQLNEAYEQLQLSIEMAKKLPDTKLLRNAKVILCIILQQNEPENALDICREIITLSQELEDNSSLAREYYNLSKLLQKINQKEEAVEEIQKSIDISRAGYNPKMLPLSLQMLGQLLQGLGRKEEALEAFGESVNVSKDINNQKIIAANLYNLAIAQRQEGMLKEALETFQSQNEITSEPDKIAINYMYQGIVFQEQGQLINALQSLLSAFSFRDSLGDKTRLTGTLRHIGQTLYKQKMLDEAKQAFQCVVDISQEIGNQKTRASGLNRLGQISQEQGELEDAEQYFRCQIKIGKDFTEHRQITIGYNSLGGILLQLGKLDEALQAFLESLELSKDRQSYGMILKQIGKYLQEQEDNIKELLNAFHRQIEDCEIINDGQKIDILLNLLDTVLKDHQKLEEALQIIKSNIDIEEKLYNTISIAMIISRLGKSLQKQEKYKEALEAFQIQISIARYISNEKERANGLYYLGKLHKEELRLDAAQKHLEECVDIRKTLVGEQQQYIFALHTLGEILRDAGEFVRAEQILRESIEICKNNNYPNHQVSGLYKLGKLLESQKKLDSAIQVFKEQTQISKNLNENQLYLVHGLMVLGTLYENKGKFNQSLRYFIDASNYCNILENYNPLVFKLTDLGKKIQEQGDLKQAEQAFSSVIKVGEIFKDQKQQGKGHNFLGKVLQKQGDHEKAKQSFKSQIDIGLDSHDRTQIVIGIRGLQSIQGLNPVLGEKFDDALQTLKSTIDLYESDYEGVTSSKEKQKIYDEFNEALEKFHQIVQIDEILNGGFQRINALANVIERRNKWNEVKWTFQNSFTIVEKLEKKYGQAFVCYLAGSVLQKHSLKNKLRPLPNYFKKSIQLAKELENSEFLAKAYMANAQALLLHGEKEKAIEQLYNSFEICESLEDRFNLGIVAPQLIDILRKQKITDKAKDYCQRAIAVDSNNKDLLKLQKQLFYNPNH